MRIIYPALYLLMAMLSGSAHALESATVGSQATQATVSVLNTEINVLVAALQAKLTDVQTKLAAMQACEALGDLYTPGHAGADANGCWSNSSSNATGTIVAFNGTTCPSGWSEYTPARGKFLRGIDNGAGYDPGGTRAPGSYEGDAVGPHNHYFSTTIYVFFAAWQNVAASYSGFGGSGSANPVNVAGYTDTGQSGVTNETRPRNIATLFCVKN